MWLMVFARGRPVGVAFATELLRTFVGFGARLALLSLLFWRGFEAGVVVMCSFC